MTNHVHLIIDPGKDPTALSQFMKGVAGRQTRYINKIEKRSGSLWESRFKSSIISTHEYLLTCSRYIDLNPLRAGMVEFLEEYPWSSYRCKAMGQQDSVIDFDICYDALGNNATARQSAYREYTMQTIPDVKMQIL
jgi:putative transposase